MENNKLLRGIKIRLLPTKEQEDLMIKTCNISRAAWNWAIALNLEREKANKKVFFGFELCSEFRKAIKIDPSLWYMKEIARVAIYQQFLDVSETYKLYYHMRNKYPKYSKNTIKQAAKQNRKLTIYDRMYHPKFKSKKRTKLSFSDRCDSMYFVQENNKMYVRLTKIGLIEIQTDHILPIGKGCCKLSNPRISFVGGKWILGCALECEKQAPKLNNFSIGIDLGIKNLAVVSYNFVKSIVFKNLNKSKEILSLERRLKRYHRKLSKCYEKNARPEPDMSNLTDYQKMIIRKLLKEIKYRETRQVKILKHRIQKLYRKLSNKRRDYIHKITRRLVNMLPKRIVLENLKTKNLLKNKHLSKAISDALWYFFKKCIMYKAEEYSIPVVLARTNYPSSKTCCFCGNIKKNLTLADRTYICDCCHNIIDRDLNAAKNLEMYISISNA